MSETGTENAVQLCRRLAVRHLGAPLLISNLAGVVWEPAVPVAPGDPVIELIALSDVVAVISGLRRRPDVAPKACAFFTGPFHDYDLEILDAWVAGALSRLPRTGTAVA